MDKWKGRKVKRFKLIDELGEGAMGRVFLAAVRGFDAFPMTAHVECVALLVPACTPAAPAGLKIGLVTDVGTLNDKNFNQFSYEGAKKAADDLGAHIETASAPAAERARSPAPNASATAGERSSWNTVRGTANRSPRSGTGSGTYISTAPM